MTSHNTPTAQPALDPAALVGRVIVLVGAVALIALVGIIVLAYGGNPIPDVLQNVAVGALTGLVGLLVPTGRTSR